MKKQKIAHREPLIRISKKDSMLWYKSWGVRAIAIFAALILCAFVIVLLTGYNPFEVYKSMIAGSFGSTRKIWILLQKVAILLCISLAVTPAFKMKFWNIGAEGQVLMGALSTAACMVYFEGKIPTLLLIPIMLAVSMLSGLIWCLIPAIFNANFKTNETLFTLMMNYVAIQAVAYFIILWENPRGSNSVGIINPSSQYGWLPTLFNQKYLLNIIIVLVVTIAMYIYLKYSKHGYEISVVGESENTAKYIGINVKKVVLRTAALSGALSGLAGLLLVSGTDHTISTLTAGGQGFTAIMVSWLANFNPIIMMLTSFLLIFLERGASEIATTFRLNQSVSAILSGIILFFIIGSEFFINYKIAFRTNRSKEDKK